MGSLQDQLLKAGLATPEQLRKARADQRREQRREPRGRRDGQDASRTPGRRPPKRARGAAAPASSPASDGDVGRRKERSTARGPAPGQDASVQALNLRIRELLDRHALNDRKAELAFNFARENTVRRVYVTDEQRRRLAGGELAIVGFRRRHHIVPAGVADEIQALRPIVFVHRAAPAGGDAPHPESATEDDPYLEFPVPDDLHW